MESKCSNLALLASLVCVTVLPMYRARRIWIWDTFAPLALWMVLFNIAKRCRTSVAPVTAIIAKTKWIVIIIIAIVKLKWRAMLAAMGA